MTGGRRFATSFATASTCGSSTSTSWRSSTRRLWAFGADRRALTTIRSRDHLGDPAPVDPRERRRLPRACTTSTSRAAPCSSSPTRACSATSSTRSRSSTATTATASCAASSPRCTTRTASGTAICCIRASEAGPRPTRSSTSRRSSRSTVATGCRSRRRGTGSAIQMSLEQDGERVFGASLTGTRLPLTNGSLGRMLVRYPLMTAKVTTLIHLQGLRLHRRGVAHVRRPRHPRQDGVG